MSEETSVKKEAKVSTQILRGRSRTVCQRPGSLFFCAGDGVQLAGQIDYSSQQPPETGYPLLFVLQSPTTTSRREYDYLVRVGASLGMAVFRWDQRGTGASGSGPGSVVTDRAMVLGTSLE